MEDEPMMDKSGALRRRGQPHDPAADTRLSEKEKAACLKATGDESGAPDHRMKTGPAVTGR
jgi:hypothetical protein